MSKPADSPAIQTLVLDDPDEIEEETMARMREASFDGTVMLTREGPVGETIVDGFMVDGVCYGPKEGWIFLFRDGEIVTEQIQ